MSEKYAKFLESPFNNIPLLSYDNHPLESGEPFFKVAFEVNVRQDWARGWWVLVREGASKRSRSLTGAR